MNNFRTASPSSNAASQPKFKDRTSEVRRRLVTMIAVLRQWKRNGVPSDVTLPKSLNGARDWVDEKRGIHGGFSKRDLNMQSQRYGRPSRWINELLTTLKSPQETTPAQAAHSSEPARRKRRYKSEKSRRIEAENKNMAYEVMLKNVTSEWHRAREEKGEAIRNISSLQKQRELDRAAIVALTEENASLKRQLLSTSRFPRSVDQ